MIMDQDDFTKIIAAVDEVMGRRLEDVYGAIEQLRAEFSATIGVMDDNDNVILGEVKRLTGAGAGEVAREAVDAWERFIRNEAKVLGLRVIAPKGEG